MLTAVLAAIVFLCAPGTLAPPPQDPPPADEMKPCLVIWRYAGNAPGANQGLEVAVWPDGAILLSSRAEALGKGLLVGKVDPNDLAAALSSIRAAAYENLTRDWVVPDSASTTILVSDRKTSRRSWHESLWPGFGGDLNADPEYREFIRTWKKTRAAVQSLAPLEVRRLEANGSFRGYAASEPDKTTWRPR